MNFSSRPMNANRPRGVGAGVVGVAVGPVLDDGVAVAPAESPTFARGDCLVRRKSPTTSRMATAAAMLSEVVCRRRISISVLRPPTRGGCFLE